MSSTEAIVRPLSKLFYGTRSATNLAKRSKFNEHIARDIAITGLFAGSLEVYVSVQIGSVFAGLALMSLAQIDVFAGLFSLCFLGIGLLLAIWPFQALRSAAKNKRDTILSELPDFADLLLMVMETWSVGQSLLFTSSRIEGVVALEMRELALALSTRTKTALPVSKVIKRSIRAKGIVKTNSSKALPLFMCMPADRNINLFL